MGHSEGRVIRRHVLVTGTVQGVGFRWFVQERARRLHLAGSVRNMSDGSVAFEVEGDAAAVEALIGAVGQGPPGARVAAVRVHEATAAAEQLPDPFAIKR